MIKGKYIIKSDGKIIAEKDNIITTNGFYMINRHLVKSNIDWAGSLAIGTQPITPNISDKELYFEIDRVPITLKSYQKMTPRYSILTKKLTSNVAYLTFKNITTPLLSSGYKIQITGVDSVFNGTYNINTNTYVPLQATITGISTSSGTITFTAANSFTAGETVIITGVNPAAYNITGVIASASSTQFTVVNPATGAYVSGGTAVQQYCYEIQYTKTASNVSLTQVVSNTSLLSVLADASGTAIYNNEIIVKGTLDPNLAARIYEVGVLPINLRQASLSALKNLTGFSEKSTTDASLSQWNSTATSLQVPLIGQAIINGGTTTQQSGYTWTSTGGGNANVTFNVSNTAGLKVGSSVFVSGATAATGSTLTPSGAATVASINGNYQLTLTMASGTNSTGSTQYGYGGTISLNTSSLGQPSTYGQFNVQLNTADTLTLDNIVIDASAYSSADSLLLSYYSPIASNNISLTINLFDNNNPNSPFVCSASNIVANVGLNVVRIPLPLSSTTITSTSVTGTSGTNTLTVSSPTGTLAVNQLITGVGVPVGTIISSISGAGPFTVTMNNNLTTTASGTYTFTSSAFPSTGITVNKISINMPSGPGSSPNNYIYLDCLKIITNDYWTAHPYAGASTITAVNVPTSSSVTGTSGTNTLTITSPTGPLSVGQTVIGTGVPASTTITVLSGTGPYTATLSNNLTSNAAGTYTFTGYVTYTTAAPHNYSTGNTVSVSGITGGTPSGGYSTVITSNSVTGTINTNTLTVTSPTGTLVAGQVVTGNGLPVGTIINSVSGAGPFTVTINNNLTIAASGTYTFTSSPFIISAVSSRTTFTVANSTYGTATITNPAQAVSSTVVTLPPEYQLTSRSIFSNPIIKNTGQQMDIEYHLQVT